MRKLTLFIVLIITNLLAYPKNEDEVSISKNEWIVEKYSGLYPNRMEQYSLFCKITYNNTDFKPESYKFIFRAQNDKYDYIEDRFIIFSGDGQEMYDALNILLSFSKESREDGLTFKFDNISLTNYNLKLLGWRTEIKIGSDSHDFTEKDFKKIIKKFEEFCKKNNIQIIKNKNL